jgi:uncharacterized protein (TIGR03067 family)
VFTWVIAGSLAVGAPALKDRPKPDRPPMGEWQIDREEHDGRAARHLSADRFWVGERSVEVGNKLQFNFLSKWSAAFFQVDGEHRADLTDPERPDRPPERAIWKVEGGRLTICHGAPGAPRPTEYSAPEGSGRVLYILSGRVGD